MKRATRIIIRGAIVVLALAVLGVVAFLFWAVNPLGPGAQAREALVSRGDVEVRETDESWLLFGLENTDSGILEGGTSVVFYPGGRVDYRSYAPLARKIAREGFGVVLVPAPLNLMVFASGRAQEVFDRFPGVDRWVISGHSLGAAMATNFVRQNTGLVSNGTIHAMVLLAGYPADGWDLSRLSLPVLSLVAEFDEVFNWETFEATRTLLPPDTVFSTIAGGNHAGFGDYGPQPGDGIATVSPHVQQQIAADEIVRFLRSLDERRP